MNLLRLEDEGRPQGGKAELKLFFERDVHQKETRNVSSDVSRRTRDASSDVNQKQTWNVSADNPAEKKFQPPSATLLGQASQRRRPGSIQALRSLLSRRFLALQFIQAQLVLFQ